MDLITILRELSRMRRLVILVGIAALLTAFLVAFDVPSLDSRRQEVGTATARMLVDTPKSQVLEVAPKGSETLGLRANLLANLMVEGDVRADIARRAGLRPAQLSGVMESPLDDPEQPTTPDADSDHVLTTRVVATTDGDLPIIEIDAQGPSAASAAKLADAAVTGLEKYLASKAATEEVPSAKRLRVTGLGSAQTTEEVEGPGPLAALFAALVVFGLGCAAILVASAALRGWRAATTEDYDYSEAELVALDGLLEYEAAPEFEAPPELEAAPELEAPSRKTAGRR